MLARIMFRLLILTISRSKTAHTSGFLIKYKVQGKFNPNSSSLDQFYPYFTLVREYCRSASYECAQEIFV